MRGGVIHAAAATRAGLGPLFGKGFLQRGGSHLNAGFDEAQEDEAEVGLDGTGRGDATDGAKRGGGGLLLR